MLSNRLSFTREVEMKKLWIDGLCAVLTVALTITLISCGGGGGSDGGSSVSATTGTVSVSLTDNWENYNAVVLSIEEVGIVGSNTPTRYNSVVDSDGNPFVVNILDYPNEVTLPLAQFKVPLPDNGDDVCFSQVRLVLSDNKHPNNNCSGPEYNIRHGNSKGKPAKLCNYIEENDGSYFELDIPSGTKSGLKLLYVGDQANSNDGNDSGKPFCLNREDNAVSLTIDIDPKKAFKEMDGYYKMPPTAFRIIEGDFFKATSYIDGLVAVPITNTATMGDSCQELAVAENESPFVTVTAYNSAQLPTVLTFVQTDEVPINVADTKDLCTEKCAGDLDCLADCDLLDVNDETTCYHNGNFKLLLPEKESYDVEATSGAFFAEQLDVPYNSTIFMELME
jgi:hypothetical protein